MLHGTPNVVIEQVTRKLEELGINIVYNAKVSAIDQTGVTLQDGTHLECNAPVWATGATA